VNKKSMAVLLGGIATGTLVAGAATGVGAFLAGRRIFHQLRDLRGDDISGQSVLITGGSRGLGLALAEEFARHGCNLILTARDVAELQRARDQIQKLGATVHTIVCDVSQPDQLQRMMDEATRQSGFIDILVNNAGVMAVGPLESQTLEDFQKAMDTMFWAPVRATLATLPAMIQRRHGRIVNISSIGGKVSIPHLLPYGCAKFAVTGFSEGLHAEVKKYGVHVLTVVPGLMRTGSHLNAEFRGKHEQEYGWFALSGTNPLISVSAANAARQIVAAARRNQAELIVGLPAKILALKHGIAPGLISQALAQVNKVLPNARGAGTEKKTGRESQSNITRSPLTMLGRRAAVRYNQS
jgi:short-subunit dehydrogenase